MHISSFTPFIFLSFSAFASSPVPVNLALRSELCSGIDRQIGALDNIVMEEVISRYSRIRGKAQKLDEFDASVEMTGGAERVSVLTRNGLPYRTRGSMAGTWSLGDFSAVLRVSRDALCDGDAQVRPVPDSQPPQLAATFHLTAKSARWFVTAGGQIRWLDFEGEIRMSALTGDVLQISWKSAPPDKGTGIREIRRTLRLVSVDVGGETYVLPESAEYRVAHDGDRVEWNTTRFKKPARYGSLVSLTF